MRGLVKHPFAEGLDEKLKEIDPSLSVPSDTVEDVVQRILEGTEKVQDVQPESPVRARDLIRPIERVLIHARGCTAVKLIRIAKQLNKKVLLVQSDPDMSSVAVDMLGEQDEVLSLIHI